MTKIDAKLEADCINAIRFLGIDAIQKSNSGHPGIVMGAAPAAFTLWDRFLAFNPKNPKWFNRDRFVLSAGHGSMLQYALLHLFGFDSVSIEDIKQFRQLDSRTPGHPENTVTAGVEVTTGPLGQGLANAVGFALAEAHLAALFNKQDCAPVDHHTFVLLGDGCQMEGIASEAASLAGHWGLGKLIALYDDNHISIDGSTDITFTEDVAKRYEAYGWHVIKVEDGNTDTAAIAAAIEGAKAVADRPSMIMIRTTIGYGSPAKADTSSCHGAPLGDEETAATREKLGWPHAPFAIPDEVLARTRNAVALGAEAEAGWNKLMTAYGNKYPAEAKKLQQLIDGAPIEGLEQLLPVEVDSPDAPVATRATSGECLKALSPSLLGLIGGSADLEGSNKTKLDPDGYLQRGAYHERNVHFGVREHAMGAICNGLALHCPGLVPYCATFLSFADYMRGAIRMSAICEAPVLYIMTHDSIGVGEDGPTHQPVEHLAALRAIPDLLVFRPADRVETGGAYIAALGNRKRPSLLSLSRQKVPPVSGASAEGVSRGAYIVSGGSEDPELILIGTGTELHLCVIAADELRGEGRKVRVVSMPCTRLFEEQDQAYRDSVLPPGVRSRVAVEAGCRQGWARYVGLDGAIVSIDTFGTSAPGAAVYEKFGMTVASVLARSRELLG